MSDTACNCWRGGLARVSTVVVSNGNLVLLAWTDALGRLTDVEQWVVDVELEGCSLGEDVAKCDGR